MLSHEKTKYPYMGSKEIEQQRLQILSELYDENSYQWIAKYLTKGASVLEFGPGDGQMASKIVKDIGSSGSYLGIEASEERVKAAKVNLGDATNAEFRHQDAIEAAKALPKGSYDVIYFRWFLWVLPETDREQFLLNIFQLLKPGGVIIAEEADMTTLACSPEHPSITEYKRYTEARCKKRGHPMQLGPEFPTIFSRINPSASEVEHAKFQPTATTPFHKKLVYLGLASAEIALKEAGVAEDRIETLKTDMHSIAEEDKYAISSTTNHVSVFRK